MTQPPPAIRWNLQPSGIGNAVPIEVVNLRKSYGSVTALDGLSLRLLAGELVALLGPNGAGKSTFVRCVSGRVVPDRGEVRLGGAPADATRRSRLVGWVPQEIALYSDLNARENLRIFGQLYGLGHSELTRRSAWALEWTGLADRAAEPLQNLSGGMRRGSTSPAASSIIRRSCCSTSQPWAWTPKAANGSLRCWTTCGRTAALLLTTHQLDEAEQRSDRILILDHGRLLAAGTFHELVDQTLGEGRQVRLRLSRPPEFPIANLQAAPNQAGVYQCGSMMWLRNCQDCWRL